MSLMTVCMCSVCWDECAYTGSMYSCACIHVLSVLGRILCVINSVLIMFTTVDACADWKHVCLVTLGSWRRVCGHEYVCGYKVRERVCVREKERALECEGEGARARARAHRYAYAYIQIHMYADAYIQIHMYAYAYIQSKQEQERTDTHVRIRIYTHIHTYLYAYIRLCIYTCIHMYRRGQRWKAAEKKIFFAGLLHAADQRKPANHQRN